MDYSRLRAAALQGGEDEEAVTVDTRALIDKVLARYSGEWTTLRELIQNSADAQATTVVVKWETLPSTQVPMPQSTDRSEILKHILVNHTLRRLVVQNDGQPFTKTDWGRLKRIAEGNPDETKIGAFGVGFYSVFADCEEPFVSSGSEAMAFYWKGNALFTKKTSLPSDQSSIHTAFVLDYRNTTTPLPNLLSVGQFLATSLTFVALQNVEFWIDDYKILGLQKKSSPSSTLALPRDLEARTKEGLMKVTSVDRTSTQIDASAMSIIGWKPGTVPVATRPGEPHGSTEHTSLRSFFARLTSTTTQSTLKSKAQNDETALQTTISVDVTKLNSSTIFLGATTAVIKTNVSTSFASELERATKKAPPKTTKLSILTASYDEAQATKESVSNKVHGKSTDVFATVLPTQKPGGRIFIGFPTMQTTGAGIHVSAPSVIPTVEREAIDLNARWVRSWNLEILRATGIVARLAYANQMAELNTRLQREAAGKGGEAMKTIVTKYLPAAMHTLQTFTIGDSTPSSQVGQIIEEAFWTCFKKASIETYSSQGVLQTTAVRLGSEHLEKFVNNIPIVLAETKSLPFMKKLVEFGLISDITILDIRKELESKALTKSQLVHFISWAGKCCQSGELDPGSRDTLLEVAVATGDDDGDRGEIISLGSIQNYLSTNRIPSQLPIPPTTIPYALTSQSSAAELQALGWESLEIVPWFRFLLETDMSRPEAKSMQRSANFAVQVLTVLSKNWDTLNAAAKETIVNLLQAQEVIPTKFGMKKATEAFFPSVKLFDDLPVVQGCEKLKEKFLVAIGVRKTVDLDTIFKRLFSTSGESDKKWSHKELITYLASVQTDIPSSDLKKLREAKFCPMEGKSSSNTVEASERLYKVSELFEPKDDLRTLGLPILYWSANTAGVLRPGSREGNFLTHLGLRSYPSVPELVKMMAATDEMLRSLAMIYFIANHHRHRYGAFDLESCTTAFLPLQGSSQLSQPSACFSNEAAALQNFKILRKDLHEHATKFGVARDPPMKDCILKLFDRPPKDHGTAVMLFNYFASRTLELNNNYVTKLRSAPIVPVTRAGGAKSEPMMSYITPAQAYLGTSQTYGQIFDFVDFGQTANSFLFQCGAKHEPTKPEVARMACNEPARLLSILQSSEKYLDLLKSLAEAAKTLQRDKELWRKMRASSFLLAYKEVAQHKGKETDLDLDDAPIRHYQLAAPHQIVVLDDIISYRLFKDHLRCAPEEDVLEEFYILLGAQPLSSLVEEDVRIGPESGKEERSKLLRKHILERSKIFLHEYANYRRDVIKHDSKWLADNFQVRMVRSVALRRSLKGHTESHTEKRSAASVHDRSSGWTLFVADNGVPDMYQIGQAICQMLLSRPNQQAYLFFEPFLTLDLYGLRARGYNVDRILRAKAAEARIAEEERRKALAAEQQRIQDAEKSWQQQNDAIEQSTRASTTEVTAAGREGPKAPEASTPVMPGSWDTADDEKATGQHRQQKVKSLLSGWGKRLGFDSQTGKDQPQIQSSGGGSGSGSEQQTSLIDQSPGNSVTEPSDKDKGNENKVTNPAVVQQNLLNAIKATRPHGSDSVFSEPKVNQVKEQASYCDKIPAQNLVFVAEASNGMKVYMTRDTTADPANFLSRNIEALNSFAALLADLGHVYSLSAKVLHIFFDETGNTIAFNTGGSIFCNLRYFLQLHFTQNQGSQASKAQVEAGTWWWVTIAHELAHNLVSPHNADHSYYTESFIQQYMGKMMDMITQWRRAVDQRSTEGLAARPRIQNATNVPNTQGGAPPPPYSSHGDSRRTPNNLLD